VDVAVLGVAVLVAVLVAVDVPVGVALEDGSGVDVSCKVPDDLSGAGWRWAGVT
jgi:hypothetical protein